MRPAHDTKSAPVVALLTSFFAASFLGMLVWTGGLVQPVVVGLAIAAIIGLVLGMMDMARFIR